MPSPNPQCGVDGARIQQAQEDQLSLPDMVALGSDHSKSIYAMLLHSLVGQPDLTLDADVS